MDSGTELAAFCTTRTEKCSKYESRFISVIHIFYFLFFLLLLLDLSSAKRKFADSLNEFKFQCIGDAETDDEMCIGKSQPHVRM